VPASPRSESVPPKADVGGMLRPLPVVDRPAVRFRHGYFMARAICRSEPLLLTSSRTRTRLPRARQRCGGSVLDQPLAEDWWRYRIAFLRWGAVTSKSVYQWVTRCSAFVITRWMTRPSIARALSMRSAPS
jgi:hypothetical protein